MLIYQRDRRMNIQHNREKIRKERRKRHIGVRVISIPARKEQ
jgi:hypothetical protein